MSLRRVTVVQGSATIGDPHTVSDSATRLSLVSNVYDALVKRDYQGGYLPSLVENWKVDESARNWVFKLRKDVLFHNKEALRPSDVVATLERVLDPSLGGAFGTQGVFRSYLGDAKIKVTGDRRVEIVTSEPMADLFDLLVAMPIAPESCLANLPEEHVGSGPYKIIEYSRERTIMEANEDYWAGTPEIKEIEWLAERNRTKRVDSLLDGQADIASGIGINGKERVDSSDSAKVVQLKSGLCIIFMLNSSKGPCMDRRVRQALNYALDMDEIIKDIKHGAATQLNGYLTPHHFGYNPETPVYHYDPEKARSLLADAGYGGGLDLVVDIPSVMPNEAPELSQLMAEKYRKVGISMKIVEHIDRAAYADMVRDKNIHDACCFDSSPRSTFRVLREKIHSGLKGPWWQGYTNKIVDSLIEKAQATVDNVERQRLYQKIYSMIRDDAPWVFLYRPTNYWGVGSSMKDWKPKLDGSIIFT